MSNILEIGIVIAVIGIQTFSGYLGNKYLGAILPIIFSGIVVFLFVRGNLSFSFSDILMPFIGLITLIGSYESANQSRKSKIKKEMEKMKAKDHIKQ
ncbi:hypothetical protein HQ655_13225 [Enterococcus faecium]|nr:hypothetical protein [Enterococcus faecium]